MKAKMTLSGTLVPSMNRDIADFFILIPQNHYRFWKPESSDIPNISTCNGERSILGNNHVHMGTSQIGKVVENKDVFENFTPNSCDESLQNLGENIYQHLEESNSSQSRRLRRDWNRFELIASTVLWESILNDKIPQLRQCLTYGEISKNRCDNTKRVFFPKGEVFQDQ